MYRRLQACQTCFHSNAVVLCNRVSCRGLTSCVYMFHVPPDHLQAGVSVAACGLWPWHALLAAPLSVVLPHR